MGAFIGYGKVGVWASNSERNAFLDWFAEKRCKPGESRFDFCKSEGNRWTGCGIELAELIPEGEPLRFTNEEYSEASEMYWPQVAQLLGVVDSLTRGEWQFRVEDRWAISWRR